MRNCYTSDLRYKVRDPMKHFDKRLTCGIEQLDDMNASTEDEDSMLKDMLSALISHL